MTALARAMELGAMVAEHCAGACGEAGAQRNAALVAMADGQAAPREARLELLLLSRAHTAVTRLCVPLRAVRAMLSLLGKQHAAVLSPFTVRRGSGPYCEFSEWSDEPQRDDLAIIWCAPSVEIACRGLLLDLLGDHAAVGALLGYPPCCVAAFASEPHQAAPLSACGHLAPMWRMHGIPLVSHLPCHPACEASTAIANGRLQLLASQFGSAQGLEAGIIRYRSADDVLVCEAGAAELYRSDWRTAYPLCPPPQRDLALPISCSKALLSALLNNERAQRVGDGGDSREAC